MSGWLIRCVCFNMSVLLQTGTAKYAPEKDCIIWTIKQFPGQKEYVLRAHFGLPSVQQVSFYSLSLASIEGADRRK